MYFATRFYDMVGIFIGAQRLACSMSSIAFIPEKVGLRHHFTWSENDVCRVFDKPFYRALIDTDAIKRLSDVRFLGAIDYFVHPNGHQLNRRRHSRFEHTLGVAQLALLYSREADLNESDEMLVVSAALLHDVGHSPLSHSLEFVFKEAFGIDHHQAGSAIVRGDAPEQFGFKVPLILRAFGVDPEAVISLFSGRSNSPHNFLFHHPVNIDTIEAISRSQTYIKHAPASPDPGQVLKALLKGGESNFILDDFWRLKELIYSLLIQGPAGLLADHIAKSYVEANLHEFSRFDYYQSERQFRRSHPILFAKLEAARGKIARSLSTTELTSKTVATFYARHFFIDPLSRMGAPERFQQSKSLRSITFNDLVGLNLDEDARPYRQLV